MADMQVFVMSSARASACAVVDQAAEHTLAVVLTTCVDRLMKCQNMCLSYD